MVRRVESLDLNKKVKSEELMHYKYISLQDSREIHHGLQIPLDESNGKSRGRRPVLFPHVHLMLRKNMKSSRVEDLSMQMACLLASSGLPHSESDTGIM